MQKTNRAQIKKNNCCFLFMVFSSFVILFLYYISSFIICLSCRLVVILFTIGSWRQRLVATRALTLVFGIVLQRRIPLDSYVTFPSCLTPVALFGFVRFLRRIAVIEATMPTAGNRHSNHTISVVGTRALDGGASDSHGRRLL